MQGAEVLGMGNLRDLAKVFLGLCVVLVHPKVFIEPLFYMTVLDGGDA